MATSLDLPSKSERRVSSDLKVRVVEMVNKGIDAPNLRVSVLTGSYSAVKVDFSGGDVYIYQTQPRESQNFPFE